MGRYGIFDDWLGGRIELFALALKVEREKGMTVVSRLRQKSSHHMVVENDHPTDRGGAYAYYKSLKLKEQINDRKLTSAYLSPLSCNSNVAIYDFTKQLLLVMWTVA